MSLLDRAKSFLSAKATKVALTAVPLAALALTATPARATSIVTTTGGAFSITNGSACFVGQGTGTCTLAQASPTGGVPGFNWVDIYSGAINSVNGNISLGVSGGATGSVAAGTSIPVNWDFIINAGGFEGGSITPSLSYSIYGNAAHTFTATLNPTSITSSGKTEFIGSGSINFAANDTNIAFYTISLFISETGAAPAYSLTIPGGSTLDLNPGASTAPEPASLFLTGSAALGALLLKRRKKA